MEGIGTFLIKYGIVGIILAAFLEATFLPLPMELVSLPVYLADPANALIASLVLIIFSILGSMTGYLLGRTLGSALLSRIVPAKRLHQLNRLYENNSMLVILSSAITPIPYEVYVLSAGFLQVKFQRFILAASISRIIRHLPQAILVYYYRDSLHGEYRIYIAVGLLMVVGIWFVVKHKRQS